MMKSVRSIISAVVPIIGDYLQVYPQVEKLIHDISKDYSAQFGGVELILVLHGDGWLRALPFYSLMASGVKVLVASGSEELPAVLFNRGALEAQGDFLSFAWPGVEFCSWLGCLERMSAELAAKPEAVFLAGHPALNNMRDNPLHSWKRCDSDGIPPGYPGGWLEMIDYAPMASSLVSREHFISVGGFSCTPLLQRGFWWEFTVRTARTESIELVDTASPDGQWSWGNFPFANDLPLSGDLIARRIVRRTGFPLQVMQECDWGDIAAFSVDLPTANRQRLERLLSEWMPEHAGMFSINCIDGVKISVREGAAPLRVVVLGGLNEPAHSQLCFFNYFALLEGQGALTWRSILDTSAHPVDLVKADLVIFSRVKSEQGCRLMDYCSENQIPTVYMLDDNWFSVAKDWPEYKSIFAPGAPLYELFMYCLARADHVLTYNKVIAEDLHPHSRRLEILPTNIDLSLFPSITRFDTRRLRVGYVGSLRKEDTAFIALSELAKEREDFDVFVMSATIPDALNDLPPHRLIYIPYVFGYRRYAHLLCEAMPDILLAPLENTRTDSSKCPNKYLEITAAGAIGIYSNVAPYNQFITNEQNGVLVRNDVAAWKFAIRSLLDNPSYRAKMLANAEQDVRFHFDTPAVLPIFMEFLLRAAGIEPVRLEEPL